MIAYTNEQAGDVFARETLLDRAGVRKDLQVVDYSSLYAGSSPLDDELFTYLISMPGLSYDVLERARPVLGYLRDTQNYIHLAAHGLSLFDLSPGRVARDLEQWQGICAWLDGA